MIKSITRRQFLDGAAKGGLALSAGGLITACASSKTSTSAVGSAATPRHGGTLTVGLTGGSSSDTLDPNTAVNNTDYARVANLYEGIAWQGALGQPYLRLAQEMVPNKDAK